MPAWSLLTTRRSPTCKAVLMRRREARGTKQFAGGGNLPPTMARQFDREITIDGYEAGADRNLGYESRNVGAGDGQHSKSRTCARRIGAGGHDRGARVHGIEARHAHRRHHARSCVHRLVHQRTAGRPAGRGKGDSRTQSASGCDGTCGSGFGSGEAGRRTRRARPHLQGSWRAVARARMLDVPGHES